tara:strand:- start:35845 stop:36828 length:984 start_codon:yes stop_codon:yes gene_type:complete
MGHFTELKDADAAELCAQFGIEGTVSVKPIAAGTTNSNYRVETANARYFLRVNEGKSEHEVQFEVSVLTHLVAAGVPTLLPLATASGLRYAIFAGKFVSVFPWRDGTHSESKNISQSECSAIGVVLAQLHLAGKSMSTTHVGRFTTAAVRNEFEAFCASPDPRLADALNALQAEFSWLEQHETQRRSQPRGLIHADLFPDNVLMQDGAVVALLDFEQACDGAYCYDLAVCLNAWCFAEALSFDRVSALLCGYQKVRRLSVSEARGLHVEVRAAAVRFLVTRIRDIHLPAPEQAPEGKDFRRFLMRLQTWQSLPPNQLADLSAASPTL